MIEKDRWERFVQDWMPLSLVDVELPYETGCRAFPLPSKARMPDWAIFEPLTATPADAKASDVLIPFARMTYQPEGVDAGYMYIDKTDGKVLYDDQEQIDLVLVNTNVRALLGCMAVFHEFETRLSFTYTRDIERTLIDKARGTMLAMDEPVLTGRGPGFYWSWYFHMLEQLQGAAPLAEQAEGSKGN